MVKNTSVKKSLVLLVALLLCVTIVFAACSPNPFTPVQAPDKAEVKDNGGLAVQYGEWLYYINGYTSDVNATNSYSDDVKTAPRVGSVVRIKFADVAHLFEIQDDDDKTSGEKSDEIADYVRSKAETVVPKIYYSGNTTSRQFTGLYIFGDRLYITTPNDELTAGGSAQTSQLVLTSFKLDGSDEQRHFVFTSNSAQISLTEIDGKLYATYIMDSKVYQLDVAARTSKEVTVNGEDEASDVDNVYNSVTWDIAGKSLFFIDKYYGICKLAIGADKYDVIVPNDTYEIHEHDGEKHIEAGNLTYTIKFVNNGQVYYTKADSENSAIDGTVLYWMGADKVEKEALNTSNVTGATAWKDGRVVFTKSITSGGSTFYGIYATQENDPSGEKGQVTVLLPTYNDNSITINRVEGDTLYYTANSISYTIDLNNPGKQKGTPYAKSLASATGWADPDLLDYTTGGTVHYVITATSSGGLTIARFDPDEPDKTQNSVSILLTKAEDDD